MTNKQVTLLDRISDLVDQEQESDLDELDASPMKGCFKNRLSNFDYNPDRSLRSHLTKKGGSDEG